MENENSETADAAHGGLDGRVLADRFRIAEVVSAGANTIIANAIDLRADQPCTVKIVQPELAGSEEFRRAFSRHADVAMALNHPNIATVVDWGEVDVDGESTVFWVVEYLGGGSLRDLFDRGRLLAPSQALVVGLEACRALEAAHQRGIVHTELTPSKLVFGQDRRLRIVDFGMARLLGEPAWQDPAHVATHVARYASPEQALGLPVDEKTDVYALSLSLIEAVTGKVPFAADSTVATLTARVGKLMPVSADLGSLAAVLERAGRPESEDRYTAAEFGSGLVQAAEALPRPEPIPVLAAGLFDIAQMRRPTDPTGGLERPAGAEDVPDDAEHDAVEALAVAASAAAATAAADAPEADAEPVAAVERDDDPADVSVTEPPPDVDVAPAAGDADADADAADADADAPHADVRADLPGDGQDGDVPDGGAEPLILLTDVADPPTGAVQVGADAPAATPSAGAPDATAQMPVTVVEQPGVLYDDERRPRRIGAIILLTLFVLAGIGALAYAGYLLTRTKSHEVPDLIGVDESVARNEIAGNGWEILTETERSDEHPAEGAVIRTDPAAGAVLDEGEQFTLVISLGPELRTLPEFEGLTVEAAQQQLADLRLNALLAEPVFDEVVPADTVVSWEVQGDAALVAGAQVLPETTVVLTASKGPAPRVVPALAGLTFDEAAAAVDGVQLVLERGEDVFSEEVEAGRVVSQTPAAETEVARDSTVTVQVSKGPDVVPLPDLEGLSYADAERLLVDGGFVIGDLLGTTEGTFVSLTIDGEPVEPGTVFPRGTIVDVIFL